MLSIPTSNACVERVFSVMSLTKTKLRNIIQYELLDALLRIHVYLSINNICCQEFNPTKEMLSNFNSKIMYNTNTISEDNYSEVFDLMYL